MEGVIPFDDLIVGNVVLLDGPIVGGVILLDGPIVGSVCDSASFLFTHLKITVCQ